MVIAVKPQIMDEVLPALGSSVGPSTVLLSIAAGRDSGQSRLASARRAHPSCGRCPTQPAAIGQGMTVACASSEVTRDQALLCNMLLEAVAR
jgi:pyrroline-5-carboxylate reductase